MQRIDVVANDFGRGHQWNRQNESHRAPYPGPKQQGHSHGQRIQSQSPADQLGEEHIGGDNMQSDDSDKNREDSGLIQNSDAAR